jgi:NADH:ubiquinone oxidoreductase subunit 5 (subunit L)/multisubunit Na+/H+ antiporter MnhA subunit
MNHLFLEEESKQKFFRKWLIFASAGSILIAAGVILVSWSTLMVSTGAAFWKWFACGVGSTSVLMAGVAVYGNGIKNRILYETINNLQRQKHRIENGKTTGAEKSRVRRT